jgi:hypothetical protein
MQSATSQSNRDAAGTAVRPIRNGRIATAGSIDNSKKTAKEEGPPADFGAGIDVQYNPEIIHNILRDLEAQVNSKCNQIQKDADFMCTSVKQAFHLELIKLPNQVKTMSLSRFCSEFGDSIEAVTRGTMGGGLKPGAALNTSTGSRENQNISNNKKEGSSSSSGLHTHKSSSGSGSSSSSSSGTVFQTPSGSKNRHGVAQTPNTASRRPREGELLLSANGSPLGEFDSTAVKAPKARHSGSSNGSSNGSTSMLPPATPGVHVPLSTGEVVDIDEADIASMSADVRLDALAKMQVMMANMQTLMKKLQAKK